MRFAFAWVCPLVLVVTGCDGTRPASYPASPTAPTGLIPPTSAFTYTVSGTVRAGGVPVVGARVAVLEQVYYAPATTDANGFYSIRAVAGQPWGLAPLVSASKPGHFSDIKFTDAKYLPISKDTQLDFDLAPLVPISIGETVRGHSADAVCAHWGYGAGPCQRIAVTVPRSGSMEVTVSARTFADIDVVRPNGTFAEYVPCPCTSPLRFKVPVEGGSTYELRVTLISEFDLTTALR